MKSWMLLSFQFPPPRGGELHLLDLLGLVLLISIPAPARGRTFPAMVANSRDGNFNSRPREGANWIQHTNAQRRRDFNSRPREGANVWSVHLRRLYGISIPAPARGRTLPLLWGRGRAEHFNSRPREGANSEKLQNMGEYAISIPAPARGRTHGL